MLENVALCECEDKLDYFIEIPLTKQLESLYRRRGFYDQLNRTNTTSYNDGQTLHDINDGSIQKELSKTNNILSEKNNISLMWYTDGVRIFKSSKYNIWGFFLVILQLPYNARYKLENLLLVAVWFGDKKPVPNLFLEPIKNSLKDLYKGVELYTKDLDKILKVRGVILCGTADLPAKAQFLAMTQYNGRFGCQVCLHEGKTVERTRVYPFKENLCLRTKDSVIESSILANSINKPVCGVKGPTILSKICPKFITSTAIDVMHCVFEGVVKKLGDLWFNSQFSEKSFNIAHLIDVVDNMLLSIKPPSYIKRRPRPIKSHFKYWKASEQKYWFFIFLYRFYKIYYLKSTSIITNTLFWLYIYYVKKKSLMI